MIFAGLVLCVGSAFWSAHERQQAFQLTMENLDAQVQDIDVMKAYITEVFLRHRNANIGLRITTIGGLLSGAGVFGLWWTLKRKVDRL